MAEARNIVVNVVAETADLDPLEQIQNSLAALSVAHEFARELRSAREKHGEQNDLSLGFNTEYRLGSLLGDLETFGGLPHGFRVADEDLEKAAKRLCGGTGVAWRDILFEEFAETLTAETPEELRAELVQVGAMALGAILALDYQQRDA